MQIDGLVGFSYEPGCCIINCQFDSIELDLVLHDSLYKQNIVRFILLSNSSRKIKRNSVKKYICWNRGQELVIED